MFKTGSLIGYTSLLVFKFEEMIFLFVFCFFSAGSRKHHRKGELTFPSIIVLPSMKKSDLPGSKNHSICEKVIKMNF